MGGGLGKTFTIIHTSFIYPSIHSNLIPFVHPFRHLSNDHIHPLLSNHTSTRNHSFIHPFNHPFHSPVIESNLASSALHPWCVREIKEPVIHPTLFSQLIWMNPFQCSSAKYTIGIISINRSETSLWSRPSERVDRLVSLLVCMS